MGPGGAGGPEGPKGPTGRHFRGPKGAHGAPFFQKVQFSVGGSFFEPTHRNGLGAPGAQGAPRGPVGPHGAPWGPLGPLGAPWAPWGPRAPRMIILIILALSEACLLLPGSEWLPGATMPSGAAMAIRCNHGYPAATMIQV